MKEWIIKAGIRAIKTFAQTLLGFMAVGLAINEIPWGYALSVSVVATIASLLTSIAGLPELKNSVGDIIVDPETSDAFIKFNDTESSKVKLGDKVTFNVAGLTEFKMDDSEEGGDEGDEE